jgi:hypothetical protein
VVFIFKKELNNSKAQTEKKQKEVLESIRYTKPIQQALMPNEK